MTEFDGTRWADPDFIKEYLDNAEAYVPFRHTMLEVLRLFYLHFIKGNGVKKILDLGCGDGVLADVLLRVDGGVRATLVDGADEMLKKARERFSGNENVEYICASFQEVVAGDLLSADFDLAVSSLAIHHLEPEQKEALFRYVFSCLNSGGYFVNIDVVKGPTDELEDWYMEVWKEWTEERKRAGKTDQDFSDIIRRYQENEDNRPDTLEFQLESLRKAGFCQVDCYYKYGVFAIFGGMKGYDV